MFRDLIPLLADRFYLVAPDLPGFGQSDMPRRDDFKYTFDNLAGAIGRFTEVIGLQRFAIYIFDYGAPVGLRIAAKHPERITAIISQNGNAYEEGLSEGWNPIQAYWREPTQANRDALRGFRRPRQRSSNTPMVWPIPRSCRRMAVRSTIIIWRGRERTRYSSIYCWIMPATSLFTLNSRLTSENASRRFWQYGAGTTRFFCPREPKRSSATSLTPMSAFSTPATSRWRRTLRKLRQPFATSSTGHSISHPGTRNALGASTQSWVGVYPKVSTRPATTRKDFSHEPFTTYHRSES